MNFSWTDGRTTDKSLLHKLTTSELKTKHPLEFFYWSDTTTWPFCDVIWRELGGAYVVQDGSLEGAGLTMQRPNDTKCEPIFFKLCIHFARIVVHGTEPNMGRKFIGKVEYLRFVAEAVHRCEKGGWIVQRPNDTKREPIFFKICSHFARIVVHGTEPNMEGKFIGKADIFYTIGGGAQPPGSRTR